VATSSGNHRGRIALRDGSLGGGNSLARTCGRLVRPFRNRKTSASAVASAFSTRARGGAKTQQAYISWCPGTQSKRVGKVRRDIPKQLEEEARAIDIAPQPPKSIAPTKKDSSQFLEEASRLAKDFPEPAVALGWQAVEDELMSAVMRLAISPNFPPHNSAMKNAELLKDQNAIDQRTLELLNRMRNLRNMAVHGAGTRGITTDEAIEFLAIARGVVEKLRQVRRG
jgi:hypothetical protein